MDKIDNLYRMDEKWIHQPWYDPNSVFRLVKITENKMYNFGVDCIWKNVQTGFNLNHWDKTMRQLTTQEFREFKIRLIIQD
jgi:hypothetical protein